MARRDPPPVSFATTIIGWQQHAGRNDLPWRGTRDPYRIWLAEIMLQQTQVATVIPYYERFLAAFPDVGALAQAPADEVMRLWAGLGYYSRARNLHRAAQTVMSEFAGRFPATRDVMESLPGVGRSTAAAIVAFANSQSEAILDGNVKRVLARHFAIDGYPGDRAVLTRLWSLATSLLPERGIERYTQGLMDLGATLCTTRRPQCARCPVNASCAAYAAGKPEAYPAPRPRKVIPHRETYAIVLYSNDEVLIERRPPAGIWGGLWSFPEAATLTEADRLISDRAALAPDRTRRALFERLPIVHHAFTHFTLDITPLLARIDRRRHKVESPGRMWLPLDDAAGAALPTPTKKIVARLRESLLAGHQPALFEEP